MRKNQVHLEIHRFGDEVPSSYGNNEQFIKVYADSNNLFEALSVAYSEVIRELQKYEEIPSFGRVDIVSNDKDEWFN